MNTWIERTKIRRSYEKKLVPEEALECNYRKALIDLTEQFGAESLGDYLEFGVCHGTSLLCMYRALESLELDHVRLFGFDSFEGLPDSAADDDDGAWPPGAFKSDYEMTKDLLDKHGISWDRVTLVKGWFQDTLSDDIIQRHDIKKASVVMVDCDMYLSAKEALVFCAPLIRDRAILFFDDWDAAGGRLAKKNMGEQRAFNEFLYENPHFKAQERPNYSYRTADPEHESYAKVFLVSPQKGRLA